MLMLSLGFLFPVQASAWCGNWQNVETIQQLVPATSRIAEHYEWVTHANKRYGAGSPLAIDKGFVVKLWQDGRWEVAGTMGNFIRHRDLDAYLRLHAVHSTGHDPVYTWPDISLHGWGMGKGHSRSTPDRRYHRYLGQVSPLSRKQFLMIGSREYDIGPAVMCTAER